MKPSFKKIVREKFGIHRGWVSPGNPENSWGAIKKALDYKPPFIEFDVILKGGEVWTGHPPQEPQSRLAQVLPLFKGKKTYPKIDIRPKNSNEAKIVSEKVLGLLERSGLGFALLSFAGQFGPRMLVATENHLAKRIKGNPKVRLHVDLRKYGPYEDTVRKETTKHLKGLGDLIHSLGVEIHEEDAQRAALIAKKFGIGQLQFWVRSWPDVPRPQVTEGEIRKALALEEKFALKVYFDINPRFLKLK